MTMHSPHIRVAPTLPAMVRTTWPLLALALAALLLGACASTPLPVEKMAVAEAAVERASSAGTRESAPAELQIAIGKLTRARQAVVNKDYERAGQLAEQAELDAHVAEAHAQAVRSQRSATESQNAARVLQEEINRKIVR
ncbi:DUF4398 domain-containing protein [Methyloversatilis sp.]|uniref:DUF4398 domain-containing protein n=1 Tax=Methyloversatilis sp. TaxID=2569862 RepID=UPI003F6F4FB9